MVAVIVLDMLLEIAGSGEGLVAQPALHPPLQMLRLNVVHHIRGFLPHDCIPS